MTTIKRSNEVAKWLIVVAVGWALCGDGFSKAKSEPMTAELESEIKELVEQIDDESFAKRQRAVTRLIEIGKPALPAVRKAAAKGGPEVAMQAKKVMEAIGITDADVIDLKGFANHPRDEKFGRLDNNDLASLKAGLGKFGKVPFDVGDKVAFLGSDRMPAYPRKLEGLKIGRKVEELHLLHGMGFGIFQGVGEGAHVANYVVNYSDKSKAEIPIVEGVDIRNWWDEEGGLPVTKGKLAWTGENEASARYGNKLRLYSGVWKNPHPEKEVVTIDMVSKHDIALLFCVGITAVAVSESAEEAGKEVEAKVEPEPKSDSAEVEGGD